MPAAAQPYNILGFTTLNGVMQQTVNKHHRKQRLLQLLMQLLIGSYHCCCVQVLTAATHCMQLYKPLLLAYCTPKQQCAAHNIRAPHEQEACYRLVLAQALMFKACSPL
jgi:hypothetical protein